MSWIQTYTGKKFDFANPSLEDIDIRDIAHALSLICRFTGHCNEFYSVGQHSLLVSRILTPGEDAFCGLMHDATEAYISDLNTPLKRRLPDYQLLEKQIWKLIALKFNIPEEIPQTVKDADNILLFTERRDILKHQLAWDSLIPEEQRVPLKEIIYPIRDPKLTEAVFLARFNDLKTSSKEDW